MRTKYAVPMRLSQVVVSKQGEASTALAHNFHVLEGTQDKCTKSEQPTLTDDNINTLVIVFRPPLAGLVCLASLGPFCKWRRFCGRRSLSRFSFLKYCPLFKTHSIRGMCCLRTSGTGHHPHVTSVRHSQTHHAHAKSS